MSENQKAPRRGSPPGTPNWVKLLIGIFIIVVLIVVVLHLLGVGFGPHGAGGAGGIDLFVDVRLFVVQVLQQL
jgi:hypothetical protein